MPTPLKTIPIGVLVRDNLGKTISIFLNFYAFIIQCNLTVDYKLNLVRLNNYVARYVLTLHGPGSGISHDKKIILVLMIP